MPTLRFPSAPLSSKQASPASFPPQNSQILLIQENQLVKSTTYEKYHTEGISGPGSRVGQCWQLAKVVGTLAEPLLRQPYRSVAQ